MENNPPQAPAGGALATGHYEFSADENEKIGRAAKLAGLWGLVCVVTGAAGFAALIVAFVYRDSLPDNVEPNDVTIFVVALMPLAVTHIAVASWYLGSSRALKYVVDTKGNDVEHMLQAVNKLATAFMIEFAIGCVAVIGGFAAGVSLTAANRAEEEAAAAEEAELAAQEAEEAEETGAEGETEEAAGTGAQEEQASGGETPVESGGQAGSGGAQGEQAEGEAAVEGEDAAAAEGEAAPEGDDAGAAEADAKAEGEAEPAGDQDAEAKAESPAGAPEGAGAQ